MQQMMILGTQVQVVVPACPLGLNQDIPKVQYVAALLAAGYGAGSVANGVYKLLVDSGYDIPSAWFGATKADLVLVGIMPGRVNALNAEMQRVCIQLCGNEFARVFRGSDRTDGDTAQVLLKAKHVPQAPVVKEETGFFPTGEA